MYRNIIATLMVVMIVCSCSPSTKDKIQPLVVDLTLNKSAFLSEEHILATVTVKNTGDKAILINSYMALGLPYTPSPIRGIAFSIIDPSGRSYVPDIKIDSIPPHIDDFITLNPSETIKREYDLWAYSYKLSEAGEYTIIANYQNSIDPSTIDPADLRIAWKGNVDSKPVFFIIK